ncbi:MAG: hypothetical protein WA821_11965 [Anaerolineales bacterium]
MPVVVGFLSDVELSEHFDDHRLEVGAATKEIYFEMAKALLETDPAKNLDVLGCIRCNGDIIRFNRITNEFAIMTASGIIRTYFKPQPRITAPAGTPRRKTHSYPSNTDYFWNECGRRM